MTAQPEYKTTTNGTIDYQHYIIRSHEIRSQDTWRNIHAIGNAVKSVVRIFHRTATKKPALLPNAPARKPLRAPRIRRVRLMVSRKASAALQPDVQRRSKPVGFACR